MLHGAAISTPLAHGPALLPACSGRGLVSGILVMETLNAVALGMFISTIANDPEM